jgi:hypothetical protein
MIASSVRRVVPGLLVIALVLALPAHGQETLATPRGERIIEALLIWRLVDDLDLNEGQIARIFPRIRELKSLRLTLGRRVPPLIRELRQLTRQTPRDDEAIRIKVSELNQLRVQVEVRRRRQLELIAATLTPEQLGRFAVIQETFEADTLRLLEAVRRVIEERPARHR